jgi:hypothetical protein
MDAKKRFGVFWDIAFCSPKVQPSCQLDQQNRLLVIQTPLRTETAGCNFFYFTQSVLHM